MKLIVLHQDGEEIHVNPNKIIKLEDIKDGYVTNTRIHIDLDFVIECDETVTDVYMLLNVERIELRKITQQIQDN